MPKTQSRVGFKNKKANKMAKETKSLQIELPANNTLTSEQFQIDANGNVVIKNEALKALLKEKLQPAVSDANTNAVSVGITVGN